MISHGISRNRKPQSPAAVSIFMHEKSHARNLTLREKVGPREPLLSIFLSGGDAIRPVRCRRSWSWDGEFWQEGVGRRGVHASRRGMHGMMGEMFVYTPCCCGVLGLDAVVETVRACFDGMVRYGLVCYGTLRQGITGGGLGKDREEKAGMGNDSTRYPPESRYGEASQGKPRQSNPRRVKVKQGKGKRRQREREGGSFDRALILHGALLYLALHCICMCMASHCIRSCIHFDSSEISARIARYPDSDGSAGDVSINPESA